MKSESSLWIYKLDLSLVPDCLLLWSRGHEKKTWNSILCRMSNIWARGTSKNRKQKSSSCFLGSWTETTQVCTSRMTRYLQLEAEGCFSLLRKHSGCPEFTQSFCNTSGGCPWLAGSLYTVHCNKGWYDLWVLCRGGTLRISGEDSTWNWNAWENRLSG